MRFTPNRLAAAFAVLTLLGIAPSAALALKATPPESELVATPATAPTSAPSTMPAGAVALSAKITAVKGIVQVRDSEADAWQKAAVGMALTQGSELRTGLRSLVQFIVEPDQTITLDRLGTVTVLQAYLDQGKATTDLGLKYGRTRYDIKATNLEHSSTIRSPGSTLAIRGTDVTYEDQSPWVPTAVCREGRAQFRNYRREFLAFGGKRKASVSADKSSAAAEAISTTKADPRGEFSGRTPIEDQLLLSLASTGGVDTQNFQELQAVAKRGFIGPSVGTIELPGPLFFDPTWTSLDPSLPSNLDLTITDPAGNVASALNPIIGQGSFTGMHSGDAVIGADGVGRERVVFPQRFPEGTYVVQVDHRGGDAAQARIVAFQGPSGEEIGSFGDVGKPPLILQPGDSFTGEVTTQNPGASNRSAGSRKAIKRR